jgi:hypothetical protein
VDPDDEWDVPADGGESNTSSHYFSHWDNPSHHLGYLQDQALMSSFR